MSHMNDEKAEQANVAKLESELQQFTGDLDRYRHLLNRKLLYTPGVQFLAERAGAYWLIDAVASYLGRKVYRQAVLRDARIHDLHFWKLTVAEDRSADLSARVDCGEPAFITQKIEFTDFPLKSIDLWCGFDGQRWTLYLPSEH